MPPECQSLWQRGHTRRHQQPIAGPLQGSTRTRRAQFPRGAQGTHAFARSQAPARPRRVWVRVHGADCPRTLSQSSHQRNTLRIAMENQVLHWPQASVKKHACSGFATPIHSSRIGRGGKPPRDASHALLYRT